jgi:hypothetical protein
MSGWRLTSNARLKLVAVAVGAAEAVVQAVVQAVVADDKGAD